MLITSNKTIFDYNVQISKELIKFNLKEAQEKYIRHWFDLAMVDSSIQGAIEVAKEMGFDDLAEEMLAHMKSEIAGGVEND